MITSIKSPCKDCTKREVGCHGKCEGYVAFKLKLEEAREDIYEQTKHNRYFSDARYKSMQRGRRDAKHKC